MASSWIRATLAATFTSTFTATLTATVTTALLTLSAPALAQPYPNKPVRMIIPFPPGGTLDTVGRMLAQKLSEQMCQTFVVDNRPAATA